MKPIAKTENLSIRRDTGELFIEDIVNSKFIHLNPTSAYVWEKCDGRHEPSEIAQEMGEELGVSVSESVIAMALNKLRNEDLVDMELSLA
ncbi:MAG: PqqD family protein [Pyrinomonadaceae bacterium]